MNKNGSNGFIEKIGFIGLGLIGGSIAKAIQKYYPEIRLYGHASRQTTLAAAHDEGVIENGDFLPLEEFAHMDIVFLCSPVRCNIDYLRKLAPLLDENCLLTDVGSVKGEIQKAADELGLSAQFIGGHPMTGSEKDGFAFSSAQLLENAYYILTRNPEIDEVRFNKFKVFISSIGSLAIEATPTLHDHATAAISHLPHIISASSMSSGVVSFIFSYVLSTSLASVSAYILATIVSSVTAIPAAMSLSSSSISFLYASLISVYSKVCGV